ncbi:MAG: phage tail tape measure protein [Alphaproteobacteria bacterium]|nr:phage tail tape measure protein [Alphaproteobacteria bacterium]
MAEFRIDVRVDPSGAVAGARRVRTALTDTGRTAERLRSILTRAFAVVGGAAALGGSVRTLAQFGQAMSEVRAITGATEMQFSRLQDTARRLGAETRFSATEAASAMGFLARAGFDTNEVLGSVEGTLRLAQAGALDLGRAADIASNVLTGFRLETSETARVVDVLAAGAANSNTSVNQLGEAMSFAAPVAAGLGLTVEETAAAIGTLSDAGIQGSRAGTGLNRVLAELESPSMRTREAFERLGVSLDQVRPSSVGLTAALEILAAAGIDTGLAFELFGQRGGPAFEVLSSGIPRVRELTGVLNASAGEADRIARIMDDNLNGALLRVRSAIEAVVLAFGEAGADSALQRVLDGIAASLRVVAANMDVVIRVSTAFIGAFAIGRILPFAGALAGIVTTLLRLPVAVARGGAAVRSLLTGATAATAAFGGLARAVALLGRVSGFLLLVQAVDLVIRAFTRLNRIVSETPTTWGDVAAVAADRFVNGLIGSFGLLVRILPGLLRTVINPIGAAFSTLGRNLPALITGQITFDEVASELGQNVGRSFRAALSDTLDAGFDALTTRYVNIASDAQIQALENFRFIELEDLAFGAFNIPEVELPEVAPINVPVTLDTAPIEAAQPALRETTRLTQEQADAFDALQSRLDPVGDAVRSLQREEELLGTAFEIGNISAAEHARLLEQLRASYADTIDPLSALTREIEREIGLGSQRIDQRQVEIAFQREVQALQMQGVTLTQQEAAALRTALQTQMEATAARQLEAMAYRNLQDPLIAYQMNLDALNNVLRLHPELSGMAVRAAEDLRLAYLDTQNDFASGIERGFIRARRTALDFASVAEAGVVRAFQGMEDAIVSFVTTGRLDIGNLVDGIIADFTRLATREFVTQPLFDALTNIFGGGNNRGGGGGGFFGNLVGSIFGGGGGGGGGFIDGVLDFFGFAQGGVIRGPGTGTSDSILGRFPSGSYIVNARSTRRFRPLLDAISGRAQGGPVLARVSNGEYAVGPIAAARHGALLEAINSAPRFQEGGEVTAPGGGGNQLGIFAPLYFALQRAAGIISGGLQSSADSIIASVGGVAADEIAAIAANVPEAFRPLYAQLAEAVQILAMGNRDGAIQLLAATAQAADALDQNLVGTPEYAQFVDAFRTVAQTVQRGLMEVTTSIVTGGDGADQAARETSHVLDAVFDQLDENIRGALTEFEASQRARADRGMLGAAIRAGFSVLTGNIFGAFTAVAREAGEQRARTEQALSDVLAQVDTYSEISNQTNGFFGDIAMGLGRGLTDFSAAVANAARTFPEAFGTGVIDEAAAAIEADAAAFTAAAERAANAFRTGFEANAAAIATAAPDFEVAVQVLENAITEGLATVAVTAEDDAAAFMAAAVRAAEAVSAGLAQAAAESIEADAAAFAAAAMRASEAINASLAQAAAQAVEADAAAFTAAAMRASMAISESLANAAAASIEADAAAFQAAAARASQAITDSLANQAAAAIENDAAAFRAAADRASQAITVSITTGAQAVASAAPTLEVSVVELGNAAITSTGVASQRIADARNLIAAAFQNAGISVANAATSASGTINNATQRVRSDAQQFRQAAERERQAVRQAADSARQAAEAARRDAESFRAAAERNARAVRESQDRAREAADRVARDAADFRAAAERDRRSRDSGGGGNDDGGFDGGDRGDAGRSGGPGPHRAMGGLIAAHVSNGEYFAPPSVTRRFGGLLSAINAFQGGGVVGAPGSGMTINIIDRRSRDAPPIGVTRSGGEITVDVRDAVEDGEFDDALARRYGLSPVPL